MKIVSLKPGSSQWRTVDHLVFENAEFKFNPARLREVAEARLLEWMVTSADIKSPFCNWEFKLEE